MKAVRTPPHIATLIFLAALSVLSLNMFLPSLANIAAEFGVDYALVSLAVAGFLAATTVVYLIAGPMADRWGRRPVVLVALSIFALASIGCALAPDIWTFLGFRVLQSAVATGSALSLAIVRDTTSKEKSASLIGYMSMAMALAPMVGPVFGGFLDVTFGWRATFWFYALAGVALFALCFFDLGETKTKKVSDANQRSEKFSKLLTLPEFWSYSLCSMFSTGVFYIFISGAPLIAAVHFGVGPGQLGIYIGSITAGFVFGNFLTGRFASLYALSTMMIAGRLTALFGIFLGLVLVGISDISPLIYFGCTVFAGLGNGLTMPSSNTGAISVEPSLTGSASGLNAAVNVSGGAVLTFATGLVLSAYPHPWVLLALMLMSILSGLAMAFWARRIELIA